MDLSSDNARYALGGPIDTDITPIQEWPYPTANDESRWHEITEDQYEYFRDVLPPKRMFQGGFFVGECARHTADGIGVYACCLKRGERFFLREIEYTEDALMLAADDLAEALR